MFKVGDYVRIARAPKDTKDSCWIGCMEVHIGRVGRCTAITKDGNIEVNNIFIYPRESLEHAAEQDLQIPADSHTIEVIFDASFSNKRYTYAVTKAQYDKVLIGDKVTVNSPYSGPGTVCTVVFIHGYPAMGNFKRIEKILPRKTFETSGTSNAFKYGAGIRELQEAEQWSSVDMAELKAWATAHVSNAASFTEYPREPVRRAATLNPTTKDTTMNLDFKTITYVNGVDITALTDDQITDRISSAENELEKLGKIKNKTKSLVARIAKLQEGIDTLVKYSDAR